MASHERANYLQKISKQQTHTAMDTESLFDWAVSARLILLFSNRNRMIR